MEQIGLEAVFLTSEFSAGVSAYVRGIGEAERRTDGFERSASLRFAAVAGAVAGVSAAITQNLLRALGELTRWFASGATKGVQSAAQLEQQMADIESVTYATEQQMAALQETAIDIGLDPRLKASVFEVADVMEILARNGVAVEKILDGIAVQTIALANATGGDFEQAARIATDAQILWNMSTSEFSEIADTVTGVVNNSKMSMTDYAYALANAGGVVSTAGLSFLDFNTIIAAISPNFKSGREAGTSLKRMFQSLVPVSGQAAAAMQRVGLLTFDTNRAMQILTDNGIQPAGNDIRTLVEQLYGMAQNLGYVTREGAEGEKQFQDYVQGLQVMRNSFFKANGELRTGVEIVAELQRAFGGLSAMQVTDIARDMFGSDAIQAVNALLRTSKEEYVALMLEISKTSAIASSEIRMQTFQGSLEILRETIESVGIAVGLELLPAMTDFAMLMASIVAGTADKFVGFFDTLGDVLQDFVGELAAGQPAFVAFTSGLGEMMRLLGYAPSSVRLFEETILRVTDLIGGAWAQAVAFITENSQAIIGAIMGITTAFAGLSIISTIGGLLTFVLSPMGQIIVVAGILGAVWNTNFLGMRETVLWFAEAVRPAVEAIAGLGVMVVGILSSLAQDFANGWNGAATATATGVTTIGQLMTRLGSIAASWGVGIVNVIAQGIMAAVGAIVEAINYIGSIMAYWMAPASPPRFLPDLDDWGSDAAAVYLEGWTQADFDALLDFGQDVGNVLRSMIAADEIGEGAGLEILETVRAQMAAALEELNATGSVSEATFAAIQAAGGKAGDEIEEFARRYIELNAAMELATAAQERLNAATEEQADAQDAIDRIKDRLQSGDTGITMDEIRAARDRLRAANTERGLAEEANDTAQDGLSAAEAELDLFKARIGVQNESFNIMAQMAGIAGEIAKKEKETLTALELQIKRLSMMQEHYRDRHRMAELDAIMADKDATAEEKKSAELEKQLILLQMQQREVEAAELGFDISEVWDWPIVLKENIDKAKKAAAGAMPDFEGMAASMTPLPDLARDFEDAMEDARTRTKDWQLAMDAIKDSSRGIKEVFGNLFGGETGPKIPWLEEINAFLDRLQQPITIPPLNFTPWQPPEWLVTLRADITAFANTVESVFSAIGSGLTTAFSGLFGSDIGWEGMATEFAPLMTTINVIWTQLQKLGATFSETLTRAFAAFEPVGKQFGFLFESWRPILEVIGSILGWIIPRAIGGLSMIITGVLAGAWGILVAALDAVVFALGTLIEGFARVLTTVMTFVGGIGNVLSGLVEILTAGSMEELRAGFQRIWDGIVQILVGAVGTIIMLFVGLATTVASLVMRFVENVIEFFTNLYNELVGHSIIPDLVNGILDWFQTLSDDLLAFVEGIYNSLILWFTNAFLDLLIAVEGFYTDVTGWFTELDVEIQSAVETMWTAVQTLFENHFGNLLDSVGTLIQNIIDRFTNTDWGQLGKDLVTRIATSITNNLGRIAEAARALVNRLISAAIAAITGQTGGGQSPSANDQNTNSGGGLPNNATGTPYWKGGLTWVGEQGAELVSYMQRSFLAGLNGPMLLNLPRGTQILSAGATEARMRQASMSYAPSSNGVTNRSSVVYNQPTTNKILNLSTQSPPMEIQRAVRVWELLD